MKINKWILLILLFIIIYFLNDRENFDINIKIGYKKSLKNSPNIPTYNYPEGSKNTNPPYKPLLNPLNTQMLSTYNNDYYGENADTGIQRGS